MLARYLLVLAASIMLFSHGDGLKKLGPRPYRTGTRRDGPVGPRRLQGFIEIFADEVTYFDPSTERRVDGLEAMRALFAPIAGLVKLSRLRDPESRRVSPRRSRDPVLQPRHLQSETGRCAARHALERHGGVRTDRREMEDRAQPLFAD